MSLRPRKIKALLMIVLGTALLVLSYPVAEAVKSSSAVLMLFIYGFLPFIGFILLTVGAYRYGRKSFPGRTDERR